MVKFRVKYPLQRESTRSWITWILLLVIGVALVGLTAFEIITQRKTTICRTERMDDPDRSLFNTTGATTSKCAPVVISDNTAQFHTTNGSLLPWNIFLENGTQHLDYQRNPMNCSYKNLYSYIDFSSATYIFRGCVDSCGITGVAQMCFTLTDQTYFNIDSLDQNDFGGCVPCTSFAGISAPNFAIRGVIFDITSWNDYMIGDTFGTPPSSSSMYSITGALYNDFPTSNDNTSHEYINYYIPAQPALWITLTNTVPIAPAGTHMKIPIGYVSNGAYASGKEGMSYIPDHVVYFRSLRDRFKQQMLLETNSTYLTAPYDCSICEQHDKPLLTLLGILVGAVPGTIATLYTFAVILFAMLEERLDKGRHGAGNSRGTYERTDGSSVKSLLEADDAHSAYELGKVPSRDSYSR